MYIRITNRNINIHTMTLEGQYEYYRCVQHDFTEASKMVNSYVRDLYVLPKKFVENTGPALDKYIKDYSFAEGSRKSTTSYDAVLDFIDQLDDFTENTQTLYNEHKIHAYKSKVYLQKVESINERTTGKIVSEYAIDFIELTPELKELHASLKKIKSQADQMVDKLEQLELRWDSLRAQVRA